MFKVKTDKHNVRKNVTTDKKNIIKSEFEVSKL